MCSWGDLKALEAEFEQKNSFSISTSGKEIITTDINIKSISLKAESVSTTSLTEMTSNLNINETKMMKNTINDSFKLKNIKVMSNRRSLHILDLKTSPTRKVGENCVNLKMGNGEGNVNK